MRHRQAWAAATLIALLAVLLQDAVTSRSAWYDEGITLLQTSGRAQPEWPRDAVPVAELQRWFADRNTFFDQLREGIFGVHPPLYNLTALAWRHIVGDGLEALRALSAVWMLLQGVLLYRYCRLRHRWAALGLFCLSGLTIFYGSFARSYAAATLALTGALYCSGAQGVPWRRRLAPALCAAALMTHYFTVFAVIGLGGFWLWRAWRERRREALAAAGLIGLAVLAATPLMLRVARIRPNHMTGFEGWGAELAALTQSLGKGILTYPDSLPAPAAWLGGALVGAGLLAGAVRFVRDRADERLGAAVFALGAHAAGLLAMAVVFDRTLTAEETVRYAGLALPALVVTLAYSIETAPRRWTPAVFAALLAFQTAQLRFGRDFRGVTARKVASQVEAGETVVVGAGHGRGVPAVMTLELPPGAWICVVQDETSCLEHRSGVTVVQSLLEDRPATRDAEEAFARACRECDVYRLASDNIP